MLEKHPVKYFAPGWFAVIMGTGGLANILYLWGQEVPLGYSLGLALAIFAGLGYIFALIPWLLRWFLFYDYVRRDLHHPVTTNFFVTMPVATAIIGTNINLIWCNYLGESLTYILILAIWILAIIGVSFFTFYTTFRMMRVEVAPQPETTNFSWIMAPIANMAILLIGNPVLGMTIKHHPTWAMSILVMNMALFGIGFFLFIFISSIIFVRLAQFALPPAETTPTFGIFLSAVGLAVIAIIDLARHAQTMGMLTSTDFVILLAAVIWGFGIWIVGIIMMISLFQFRKGGIPFSLGWWAFIFPLAAYTLASQKIAWSFVTPLTYGYTVFLTVLLILLWLYTFAKTIADLVSGKLLRGVPIVDRLGEVCALNPEKDSKSQTM